MPPSEPYCESTSSESGVAAVNRALSLLAAFTPERPSLTLAQLAAHTGLYKSTILRLAQSLTAFGYLVRTDEGVFALGPAPLQLAGIYRRGLHPAEQVMPLLRALVQETGESASLYLRAGQMRVCAYRVPSPRAVTDNVQEGELLPLHQGAGGHVLLAFTDGKSPRHEVIRQRLVVVSRGERAPETAAVAVPVFTDTQRLYGALSLSGPIARFTPQAVAGMRSALLTAAQAMTLSLGGDTTIYQRADLCE